VHGCIWQNVVDCSIALLCTDDETQIIRLSGFRRQGLLAFHSSDVCLLDDPKTSLLILGGDTEECNRALAADLAI